MAGKSFIKLGQTGIGTQTTTERTAGVSTATGTITFDVTEAKAKIYKGDASGWADVSAGTFSATGGVTSAGIEPGDGSHYHVFISPGTFTVAEGNSDIVLLVVGGGGGGASEVGGGGGGGGVLYNTSFPVTPGDYSVTVGQLTPRAGDNSTGPNGNPSGFGPQTAGGGGGGGECGTNSGAGQNGQPGTVPGSGGGLTGCDNPGTAGTGQGSAGSFPGGDPQPGSNITRGGTGGGGGGAKGGNPTNNNGGNGGAGRACPEIPAPAISPQIPSPLRSAFVSAVGPTGLFGGGGGGGNYGGNGGSGGPGGGGDGHGPGGSNDSGDDATRYTGGGGGGGSPGSGSTPASLGGEGIVVVKYPA